MYDTEHAISWTKSKLQGQLPQHSSEDILGICTVQELKIGLSLLGLSTTGKKKDLYERLVEGCNSNTNKTTTSKTKKATSNKSAKTKAKTKAKSTSKTTKKKTSESSLGNKLIQLLEGDGCGSWDEYIWGEIISSIPKSKYKE